MPNPQTGVLTPAAMLKQSNAGLAVFYLMPDQLGSVQTVVQARNVVDATGQAINNIAFVAYSTALGDSKVFYRDDFSKNGGFNLRAPGQYLDVETGLLYNNARYFNPWIGAFISADPIGKNGGTNVYAYGVGSLINDVDADGYSAAGTVGRFIGTWAGRAGGAVVGEIVWLPGGGVIGGYLGAKSGDAVAAYVITVHYDLHVHRDTQMQAKWAWIPVR